MYIFKQPRIGGEVRWHQDASYLAAVAILSFTSVGESSAPDEGSLRDSTTRPNGKQYEPNECSSASDPSTIVIE